MPSEARSLLGCLGFSCHSVTRAVVVESEDAETRCASPSGTRWTATVTSARLRRWNGDERLVVHLVDVVAGQDQDDVAGLLADHLEVDEHRVRGAAIPLGRSAARDVRLQQPDAALVAVEVPRPARADVVVKRARVVLRQDEDVVDLGVDAVRKREVDDPVLARERDGGLGADRGQDRQPLPFPTGKDDGGDRLHAAMLHRAHCRRVNVSTPSRESLPRPCRPRKQRRTAVEPGTTPLTSWLGKQPGGPALPAGPARALRDSCAG